MAEKNQQKNQQKTQDVSQLQKVRRDKLAELQAAGNDPFVIVKYDQTHHTAQIRAPAYSFICRCSHRTEHSACICSKYPGLASSSIPSSRKNGRLAVGRTLFQ